MADKRQLTIATVDGVMPDAAQIESVERQRHVEERRVAVSSIRIETRIRQDMGDLQDLAESLKKTGQLQPVVVDEDLRLLAGERRLRAAVLAGIAEIDVRVFSGLSEAEKELVELDENRKRKDFTANELARYWVEKKEYVQAALKMLAAHNERAAKEKRKLQLEADRKRREKERREYEARLQALQAREEEIAARMREFDARQEREEAAGSNGPPEEPSDRQISDRLGVSRVTLDRAEAHVAAMDKYPFLDHKDWNQQAALEVAGRLAEIEAAFPELIAVLVPFLLKLKAARATNGKNGTREVREALSLWASSPREKQQRLAISLLDCNSEASEQVQSYLAGNRALPDDRRVKLHGIVPMLAACLGREDVFQERFRNLHATAAALMHDLQSAEEENYAWLR